MQTVSKNGHMFDVEDGYEWFWDTFETSWEPHTFQIFDRFVKFDSIVFDIGAWIGPTAMYLSRIAEEVYAFEPDPVAYNQLRKNKMRNALHNLEIQNIAMSDIDGTLEMGMKGKYGDSMSSQLWSDQQILVKCESLSEWLEDKKPTFIKMDIEGGEFYLLPSIRSYLDERRPTLYLSLHTRWFADREDYLKKMCHVLSVYKHLFNEKGQEITLADIENFEGFESVVATDLSIYQV